MDLKQTRVSIRSFRLKLEDFIHRPQSWNKLVKQRHHHHVNTAERVFFIVRLF